MRNRCELILVDHDIDALPEQPYTPFEHLRVMVLPRSFPETKSPRARPSPAFTLILAVEAS
jgi:hypothetical protein